MLAAYLLLASLAVPAAPARDARAAARAIEARYRSARTLKAIFLERYRAGRKEVRIESGTAYFSRAGRMRWEYESPERKLFLADGKHVWFYVPADHTASRASIKQSSDWHTPLALLAGKADLTKLCGRIELVEADGGGDPEARATEAGNVVLRCLPRGASRGAERAIARGEGPAHEDDASEFREVLIEADATNQLVRIVIREPGDIETEIRFGNWLENLPLAESLFHFEPPPGVAIVDEAALSDWTH
jgi:outer membrane lipoprotein carrier protein